MFKQMRRMDKIKSKEDAIDIMEKGSSGVLSLIGDGGRPYGVPISYVYHENKIYFHSALEGQKIDAIRKDPRASFCVIGADNLQAEKFTTMYKSVICFGKARIIERDDEKQRVLELILQKYSPDFMEGGLKYIKAKLDNCCAIEMEIEQMTGKGSAN